MQYDFDSIIDRRGTGSLKWDVERNELPMWVADMDFKTAPEIIEALKKRIDHGVFGYSIIPDEWYDAYIGWWKKRHGFEIEKDWLIFTTGVVPAISSAVRKLSTVGENVLVQTPVYNIFFNSIVNNGRHILENPLKYENSVYDIDFDDLEKKLSNPQTSMMILCNPQNPVGKIWNKETLAHIGELCKKYSVVVISDEIHCDITDPSCNYVPFASVSDVCRDISVTCVAPTKAFNIAGLNTAAVIVPNEVLRHRMNRALNTDEVAEPNAFAVAAAVAAFTKGENWLDALRDYIFENKKAVKKFIEKEIPEITLISSNATYLLWLDCSKITGDCEKFSIFVRKETGLYLTEGGVYGGNGKEFLRMNIACPREVVKDGLIRLKNGALLYKAKAELIK